MNFDAFWQTHRQFLTWIAGGLVVFFILEMILGSTVQSGLTASQQKIRAANSQLGKQRYTSTQVSELSNRSQELEGRITSFAQEALPPLRERFAVPEGASPNQHYIRETGSLRKELRAWALRQDCEIDETLGLPTLSPTQPAMIARVLRGLDVVERVCRLGVQAGARKIENISIGTGRRSVSRNAKGPLLDTVPVSLELVFEADEATPFLRALLAQSEASSDGPLGLVGLEVQNVRSRKRERRILIHLAAGELPKDEEVDA